MASSPTLESLLAVALALIFSALSPTTNTIAVSAARPLEYQKQLMVRLAPMAARLQGMDEDENNNTSTTSSTCWESLFELQACTGEVILFFLNGETYLGRECCHAIHIIRAQCWPSMLGSLGYTAAETDILSGYCDAAVDAGSLAVPSAPEMEFTLPNPPSASAPTLSSSAPRLASKTPR